MSLSARSPALFLSALALVVASALLAPTASLAQGRFGTYRYEPEPEEEDEEDEDSRYVPPNARTERNEPPTARSPAYPAPQETPAPEEGWVEPSEAPEPLPDEEPSPREPEPEPAREATTVTLSAGLGAGTIGLSRPTASGRQVLPRTAFAAATLDFRVRTSLDEVFSLEVALAYATSVGLAVRVEPLFGLGQDVQVRTQRAELYAAPIVHFDPGRRAFALALPTGVFMRAFAPKMHQFDVPSHLLFGPMIRPELVVWLGQLVHLRVGPELQWLLLVDESIRRYGSDGQGLSVGAQAQLTAELGQSFELSLVYRESHGYVPQGARRFEDLERFATARFGGRF